MPSAAATPVYLLPTLLRLDPCLPCRRVRLAPALPAELGQVSVAGLLLGGEKELYGAAHYLAFPIRWDEPFGLVMIEAMACGTPVVALRRGSAPDARGDAGECSAASLTTTT
jgi:glycosyltransferase involved in cell wall biosynthesis